MWIRYKWWDTDGVSAHKAIRGASEYVFLDSESWICYVRDRVGIEYLLERKANYELAYERYGVTFDAQGQQVEQPTSGPGVTIVGGPMGAAVGTVPTFKEALSKRKPGRPRRG